MFSLAIITTCFSTIVQYYNYALFGLASLTLAQEFMLGSATNNQLLNLFGLMALSVWSRPLGSLIFGSLGDRTYRSLSVIFASILSSLAVLMIAFLPSYEDAGTRASILLILLRMLFLIGLTGEIDGIRIFVAETISRSKKNLGNGMITFCTQLGVLFASLTLNKSILNLEWRECFILGGCLGCMTILTRSSLMQTEQYHKKPQHLPITLKQIIIGQNKLLFETAIIAGAIGSLYHFYFIFLGPFLQLATNIDYSHFNTYLIVFYGCSALVQGKIADRIGEHKVGLVNLIFSLCNAILLLLYLQHYIYLKIECLLLTGVFFLAGFAVPGQVILKQQINAAIRYRVFSLGHSFGTLIISSPTPYFCLKLWNLTHQVHAPIYYLISVITMAIIVMMRFCYDNPHKSSS